MLVNSNRHWPFSGEVPPGILPWSGVVVFWDKDDVVGISCGPCITDLIEDAIKAGVEATSMQVFQSHKPDKRAEELRDSYRRQGVRLRLTS